METTHLIKRLKDEGQKVTDFLIQLDEHTWDAEIYTENEVWKVHQILAADIVSGGRGAPEDFDLDRFNHEQVRELQSSSRQELIDTFSTERVATIEQASQYSNEDLMKEGNHPWFGQVSVSTLLKLLYRHNRLHLRDIRRNLSAHIP